MSVSSWIEVSREALAANIRLFRGLLAPGTALLGVVKANAYGHGVEPVVRSCVAEGVDMLGVHSAREAAEVRRLAPETPILVMGPMTAEEVEGAVDPGVHTLLSSPGVLEALAAHARRLGAPLPVHIKVDTGTHRQGVYPAEAAALALEARRRGLEVAGVATHFANIEDTTDHTYARAQLERFRQALAVLRDAGIEPPAVHAACSAAALLFREADFTMVRVGISLYGHWPSKETYLSWLLEHGRNGVKLRPALSWRTRVGQLKVVPAGEPVGYGLTHRTTRLSHIAVLPVGYAEGYPRALSNRATVLVGGRRAPVVGRVCMDIVMVDVTDVPGVREGDVVTLIGRDGAETVSAEDLAELAGTINYEVLSRLSPQLPRRLL